MKKMTSVFLTMAMVMSFLFVVPVHAGIIGEVITTDIVTYIDEQPIESYNINDYTYVIAEELKDYGFDVRWRAAERRLEIYEKGGQLPDVYPSKELIHVRKDSYQKGAHAFDVYATDIVTTLNNEPVNAYNVNGQTLIQVDELSRFAYFSYNDAKREVKIDKAAWYADWLYNQSTKEELNLPCTRADGKITYSGHVSDGKPNGLGRITEVYENDGEGLTYHETVITTGKFVDGQVYSPVMVYSYKKRTPLNGTDRRIRETKTFQSGSGGADDGMRYSVTYYDDGFKTRTEERLSGDTVIYRRETVYDPEYRFGYRVVSEGTVNSFGEIAGYESVTAGKITHVEAEGFTGLVTDEKGTLFATGFSGGTSNSVPVKIAEDVKMAAGENIYLSKTGALLVDGKPVAEGVVEAAERVYLKKNGELCQMNSTVIDSKVSAFSASGGLVLYIKDKDAYYLRLNFEEEGSKWSDGYDLSAPVKVFENVKTVSRGNRFLVVDKNNTLWGWSSYWYGTPYEDKEGNLFTCKKPIKLAENVAFADSGIGFIAYVTTKGELFAIPDNTEPGNKSLFDIKEPTHLASGITQISAGGSYLLMLSDSGQLLSWGENKEGRLGIGVTDDAKIPTVISAFYVKTK